MQQKIIIGSRGSDLALWQAHFLQRQLLEQGYASEINIIKTQGDKIQHLSLEKLEGKGFFTKEIEDALLNGDIDVAVHSHKDLPTESTPGLCIGAVSYRESPAELLLIRKENVDLLKEFHLKENAVVGTSSSRRNVQLKFFRPDINCADIRGNVPTRINKLRNGDFDAILLAYAGVHRLNLDISDLYAVQLNPEKLIPAPAQGVLAFQCRENDDIILPILFKINHPDVAERIYIERRVMNLFNGGCHMPLGVFCKKEGAIFQVWASQTTDKNLPVNRMFIRGTNGEEIAQQIFKRLPQKNNKTVFISTEIPEGSPTHTVLHQKGLTVLGLPCVELKPLPFEFNKEPDWLFFTSKNAVVHFFNQVKTVSPAVKFAAIGEATASTLNDLGYVVDFVGEGSIENMASQFEQVAKHTSVLFPAAANRQTALQDKINLFAHTQFIPVYDNHPFAISPIAADILVFTSPLNVDGYLLQNTITQNQMVIAIGATTAAYLKNKGVENVIIPAQHHLLSVAELICGLV